MRGKSFRKEGQFSKGDAVLPPQSPTLGRVAQAGYSSIAHAVICLVMQTVGLVMHSVVRSRPGADLAAQEPGPIRPIPEV